MKLPHLIKKAAQRLVKEDGVALTRAAAGGGNQWIAAAVAEKIGDSQ